MEPDVREAGAFANTLKGVRHPVGSPARPVVRVLGPHVRVVVQMGSESPAATVRSVSLPVENGDRSRVDSDEANTSGLGRPRLYPAGQVRDGRPYGQGAAGEVDIRPPKPAQFAAPHPCRRRYPEHRRQLWVVGLRLHQEPSHLNDARHLRLSAGSRGGVAESAGERAINPQRTACRNAERRKAWWCPTLLADRPRRTDPR